MEENQIEGGSGRAQNVEGEKSDTPAAFHSMGTGENSAVAMRQMGINKQQYDRDQGVDARYLLMPSPDRRPGMDGVPPLSKGDSQITS